MASTRNKNCIGDYCLEQNAYNSSYDYRLYKYGPYGFSFDPKLPGNGLLPGQFRPSDLSENPTGIESFLFGINSTNLVNPQKECFTPRLKRMDSANIYEKEPVYMPVPLVVSKFNRPFPIP